MKDRTFICAIAAAFLIVGSVEYAAEVEMEQVRKAELTKRQGRIAKYFIGRGVSDTVNKAIIVSNHSKHPKIAEAQAVGESNVKPDAVDYQKLVLANSKEI